MTCWIKLEWWLAGISLFSMHWDTSKMLHEGTALIVSTQNMEVYWNWHQCRHQCPSQDVTHWAQTVLSRRRPIYVFVVWNWSIMKQYGDRWVEQALRPKTVHCIALDLCSTINLLTLIKECMFLQPKLSQIQLFWRTTLLHHPSGGVFWAKCKPTVSLALQL